MKCECEKFIIGISLPIRQRHLTRVKYTCKKCKKRMKHSFREKIILRNPKYFEIRRFITFYIFKN